MYHFGNLSRLEAEAKKRKNAELQAKALAEKEKKAADALNESKGGESGDKN
jgi:NADH-quinone oxidoreductase subunit I